MNLNFIAENGDFEGIANYGNISCHLTIVDFNANEIEKATDLAVQISGWLGENLEIVKMFTASALIKLKNESWLDEKELPVSEQAFMNTIEPESILAFPDETFEIYFNDNNLFWGHSIRVEIDEAFKIQAVNLLG